MPRPLSQILAKPKDEEAALLVDVIARMFNDPFTKIVIEKKAWVAMCYKDGIRRYVVEKPLGYSTLRDTLAEAVAHAERLAAEGE